MQGIFVIQLTDIVDQVRNQHIEQMEKRKIADCYFGSFKHTLLEISVHRFTRNMEKTLPKSWLRKMDETDYQYLVFYHIMVKFQQLKYSETEYEMFVKCSQI